MKARLIALLTLSLLCLGLGAATVAPAAASNPLQGTCVALYEDVNGGGDRFPECSTFIGDINLHDNANNLNGGCNGANWPLTNGSWGDCVSSFGVSNLPAGFKVIFYVHTNYEFRNKCVDQNGSYITNMDNVQDDRSSSYRIYSGDC